MNKGTLHIAMFSIHGLLRGENMELGRDADTGGQIKYVIELAHHLGQRKEVKRVDLFTRLIRDKTVSEDYSQAIETINDKFRIVRIQCGGLKYMRKELLWPHLDEYVDKTIKLLKRENAFPDIVHGHYADGGYVAMQMSAMFGLPFVFTGHSLGRAKKQKLLNDGLKEKDIVKKYKIDHRIQVEEDILKQADLVIASTRQEIEAQYGMYRDHGLTEYRVLPPGLDVDKFYPFYHDTFPENEKSELARYAQASVLKELNRFFLHPDKPLILALCRPDQRKNISGLIQAYGEDLELQAMANLAIFAGIRKDIEAMEDNERDVLTRMLLLMDKYDLYGKMAIPKKHDFEYEVPALYRIAAARRGVFVNPALIEPFGITLLEASSTGLPIVATADGGPQDIIKNCRSGLLVDPTHSEEIAAAAKQVIKDTDTWEQYSKNGILNIRKHYTWESHAKAYISEIKKLERAGRSTVLDKAKPSDAIGRRLAKLNYMLFTDIDNTLIGENNTDLEKFLQMLSSNRDHVGFGVATGRTVDSAVAHLKAHGIPEPDIVISSVGAEIYYGKGLFYSQGWHTHIGSKWNRRKIVDLLKKFKFLKYQEEDTQRPFKISYFMDSGKDRLASIHHELLGNKCKYTLIYSHGEYLDILPQRASKGKAIRYLSYKWEVPLSHFLVCGDSGNDEEMLKGEPLAVVVGNYSQELDRLKGGRNVFFAKQPCVAGILEGADHYRFFEKAKGKNG